MRYFRWVLVDHSSKGLGAAVPPLLVGVTKLTTQADNRRAGHDVLITVLDAGIERTR